MTCHFPQREQNETFLYAHITHIKKIVEKQLINSFFTKDSRSLPFIREQKEQKPDWKSENLAKARWRKREDVGGSLRASTAERDRKAAAERRQRKEKEREVFLSSSRMIRRMVQRGAGSAQAWTKKGGPF